MQGEGERLKTLLRANGVSQEEAAKVLGMTRQNLALYFHRNKLPDGFVEKLQGVLQINIAEEPISPYQTKGKIPIYDIEATAGDIEWNGDMPERVNGYISLPNFRECIAFLYIRGDSMYPMLKAGDLIGLIPVQDTGIIQFGNVYLIITNDNQRMVKSIRRGEEDMEIILRSKNKEYDDILLPVNKIRKLFMVKGPIRDEWQ